MTRTGLTRTGLARSGLARTCLIALALAGLAAAAGPAAAQLATVPSANPLEMAPEDRARLRAEVRRYLLEHPEVIMEAVEILDQRRREAAAAADRDALAAQTEALRDDGYSVVIGNPDGDLTMVEFVDYNCSFCRRSHPETRALIASDPNLRYVIKELPILGPDSRAIARLAMAATMQDGGARYLAFNDALMGAPGRLTEAAALAIAEDVGLDVEQLQTDAARPEIGARLDQTGALARALGIEGTPSFVIGSRLERGYLPLEQLRDRVAAERARDG